ncbi:MAG: S8 family serine peptidase [Chloroflexota bacterium]
MTVAVIDSGICANHPDLQGRITAGYDFVDDDNDPNDTFGHGCGVAGVIAANTNNGIGIAGIAPNVQIMPLRVLDNLGLGSYSNIANAIIYAVDNGADIINLSLAGPTSSVMLEAAVAYAVDSGVVVIAAAGNFGQPNAFYPAAYPSVIAVASIDPVTFERSSFSNYGADVDVLAPGRDILTTNLAGDYEFVSGTSFAAPIVAGITAMSEALNTPLKTEDGNVFLYPPDALPNCP